jgi:hypothetical protein
VTTLAMYCAAGITASPMARTATQIGSKSPPITLPAAAAARNA